MQVTVNGEVREIAPTLSVLAVLQAWGLDPRKVALELNGAIVPKSQFASVSVGEGDVLEIVHIVGGG